MAFDLLQKALGKWNPDSSDVGLGKLVELSPLARSCGYGNCCHSYPIYLTYLRLSFLLVGILPIVDADSLAG